jgi:hypothetical protein
MHTFHTGGFSLMEVSVVREATERGVVRSHAPTLEDP